MQSLSFSTDRRVLFFFKVDYVHINFVKQQVENNSWLDRMLYM